VVEQVAAELVPDTQPRIGRVVAVALLLGVIVTAVLTITSDAGAVADAFRASSPAWFLLALLCGFAAHGVKFGVWHYLLMRASRGPNRQIGVRESALLFGTGILMLLTPGHVGEFVKSYYASEDGGPSIARTAPVIIAERAMNILGLVIVSIAGVLVYREAAFVVGASALLAFVLLGTMKSGRIATLVTAVVGRIPVVRGVVPHAKEFTDSAGALLSWRNIAALSVVSAVSWSFEAAAFILVLHGFGLDITGGVINSATFAWVASTLAGGLLLSPGGLGVVEGGVVGISLALIESLERGPATAAALLTRVATLWIPAGVGVVCALALARRSTERARHAKRRPVTDIAS